MKIVNIAPHPLNLVLNNGKTITIEPCGTIPRIVEETVEHNIVDEIEINTIRKVNVINLPEPEEGTLYFTSRILAAQIPTRKDLVFPAEFIRDASGNIIGCKGLAHY